jgi:hypothetical protein
LGFAWPSETIAAKAIIIAEKNILLIF